MSRIEVLKTCKLFIGGDFPRSESGRHFTPVGKKGKPLGNFCLASRKDFRNAVVAARLAQKGWSARAAFNRSQILYRIAEMLESRAAQFEAELVLQGSRRAAARKEVARSVDLCVCYAGWCDKYQQVFSAVNPVASSHFNFSVPVPVGVVAAIAPECSALVGLLGTVFPILAGGNSAVVLASETKPLSAVALAEVLATSDLPGGVVNILTGHREELLPPMATHMDVNAIVASDLTAAEQTAVHSDSAGNLKRPVFHATDVADEESPFTILATQEIKTTWHPVEASIAGGSSY